MSVLKPLAYGAMALKAASKYGKKALGFTKKGKAHTPSVKAPQAKSTKVKDNLDEPSIGRPKSVTQRRLQAEHGPVDAKRAKFSELIAKNRKAMEDKNTRLVAESKAKSAANKTNADKATQANRANRKLKAKERKASYARKKEMDAIDAAKNK